MDEALLDKEDLPLDKRDDWEEVQNYIQAMEWAIGQLDKLPVSLRLIRETHRVLLQGARGAKKQPGEFRISQNWIGGATINDAVFIPPVHTSVPKLMSDIELMRLIVIIRTKQGFLRSIFLTSRQNERLSVIWR